MGMAKDVLDEERRVFVLCLGQKFKRRQTQPEFNDTNGGNVLVCFLCNAITGGKRLRVRKGSSAVNFSA